MRAVFKTLVVPALALCAAQQTNVIFRAGSDLVVVDVAVRDRSGKDVSGLKKEDFTILEDGKLQALSVFEFQQLSFDPAVAAPAPAPGPRQERAQPGAVHYQDRRLMVLFLDLSAMPAADQIRARKAAMQFVGKQMTPADMVSVMTFSSELKVLQEFTDDRDLLIAAIGGLRIGETSELAAEADTGDENSEDTGAAFTADESEFNIFNTDRKLSALESAAKMLSGFPEKKALVYFSSGVGKTGVENQSQLRSTINAANRANVSFYPIDARGLVAASPGGDASKAAPRGNSIFTGGAQTQQRARFNDQQETLVSLAADTGGKALLDHNDLTLGIVQAQRDIRSYYILGYYSTNREQDGRYRRIQVKLKSLPQAKLDFRGGYFAPKQFAKFTSADKESQLEQALLLGDPVTDLPLALEVNYFRLSRDRYFIPVAVKISGNEISLAKKGSNEVTEFDFIGQVRDEKGALVTGVRDAIRIKLDEANAAELNRRSLQYDTGFMIRPGAYRLKMLVRENQTGKMGTFETKFLVPDLSARSDYLRISSVVWSSQRESLAAAVGSAGGDNKLLAANPLVEGGQKLIPSITHVFRKDQNLYVYAEAYDPGSAPAGGKASMTAAVSFFRGRVKAFETAPLHLTEVLPNRPGTLPIRFQVPLEKLTPGQYTCQVSVVDEIGKKFAFPRARMVLLP